MHFCQSFGVSKFLTGRENGSQKALPDRNLALKIAYRTGIWLSKSLTGREFGSQNRLGKPSKKKNYVDSETVPN